MDAQQPSAQPGEAITLYEMWRPIIRPRRRVTIERIHQNLAEDWSSTLRDFLARGEQFEFAGLSFESFQQLSEKDSGECQTAAFAIERTEIVGFLLLTDEQARTFVDNRLGMGEAHAEGDPARRGFSRIEGAIVRDAINLMLTRLGAAYAAAGLGLLVATRQSERLKDTLVFSLQDYLVVLRFRVGAVPNPVAITIAISSNVINAVRDMVGSDRLTGESPLMRAAASELPMRVDVVLGSWAARADELAAIEVGQKIVLPDGADAWLEAGGVRLAKIRARFDDPETTIDIRPERNFSTLPHEFSGGEIVIEAVLARLRIATGMIAALTPDTEMEVEPEVGLKPMVRFVAGGRTIATASIAKERDCLVATISALGAGSPGRKDDRWLFRKKAAANLA